MLNLDDLRLWAHQRSAVDVCDRYFAGGSDRAALVHLPTGTGKTGVIATLATRCALAQPVLVVCPSTALVDQLIDEIRGAFWDRIGAEPEWVPEEVVRLLPSKIDQLVEAIDSNASGSRLITIGTIQALQQIHAGPDYAQISGRFGTVFFDEGHREPAPAWALAIRGLGAAMVLFSATPFRNDLKLFDVDLEHVDFLSFKKAVTDGLIRNVDIIEVPNLRGTTEFARYAIETRDQLIHEGRFEPNHKMIVRADNADNVRALFAAFTELLGPRAEGVLALHNTFVLDGPPGRQLRPDVPKNLRDRTERFLIHQFMLTEGIDDPACTMLALYEPFSTERQLVQQVGRLTRHPGPLGNQTSSAYVFSQAGNEVETMWNRFLAFDDACVRNGDRPPLRNDASVLADLVGALPEVDYISGKFRTRLNIHSDLSNDIRVPLSAIILELEDHFEIEQFQQEVSRALFEDDRFQVSVGEIAEGACRYHLTMRLQQSPFLAESLFQSATLEVTIYALRNNYLFFYDSAGLWIDDADGINGRLAPQSLQKLLPESDENTVTLVAMKNTDLGPSAIRSRSLSARSLEHSGVFMGEHLNVVTRTAGRVGTFRRALGIVRSRLRQGEGAKATAQEFYEWSVDIVSELDGEADGANLFNRFAESTGTPADTTPQNILVDLDGFVGEFINDELKDADFDLENVCVDVEVDPNGPEDFGFRFDLVIDSHNVPVWMKWDSKKRKYWVRSDQLSKFKLKDNDRITLTRRLNQQQPFRIIPTAGTAVYAFGRFYALGLDLARPGGPGGLVLDLIQGVPGLSKIKSEKGDLKSKADTWPKSSLFGLIDRALRPDAPSQILGPTFPALVCDDIGQEAADFIAADDGQASNSPRAVLVAAKWKDGKPGVSASAIYDICGQVVKNLAYLKVDAIDLPGTPERWNKPWRLKGGIIPRRRAGPGATRFRRLFQNVRSNPSTQREIWMVLGGGILSRQALENQFARAQPAPHAIQFYHLVLSTYSACQSVGVRLRIICAE